MGQDDESLNEGERAFPVALKGRVPIRLSNENGSIKKGDRIQLSSIPGIGMKATKSSVVVGIALEDFDGGHAYSAGYLNQFGDDLVKAKVKPYNQNTDTRTQDGCSFGAGNEEGGVPCTRDVVNPIVASTTNIDNRTEVLRELEQQKPSNAYTSDGREVSIGQVIMFVDLSYYALESEQGVLSELLATSTVLHGNGTETLWDRLTLLAQNFVDGVLTLTEVIADTFTAGEVKTNVLCIGNTCVDEATLKALLESPSQTQGKGIDTPPPSPEPTDPPPDSGSGEASSTPGDPAPETPPDQTPPEQVPPPEPIPPVDPTPEPIPDQLAPDQNLMPEQTPAPEPIVGDGGSQ
jgi:hypothetical protein